MIIQWTTYRMPTACVMGLAAALCCATAAGVGAQGLAPGTWELKMAGSMFSLHANEARVSDVVSSIDAMIPADVHIGSLPDRTVSGTFHNLALDDLLDRMDVDYVLFYETGDTPDHAVLQRALMGLENVPGISVARLQGIRKLIENLRDDDVRFNAVNSLDQLRELGVEALPALELALQYGDYQTRQFAAEALYHLQFSRDGPYVPSLLFLETLVEGMRDDSIPFGGPYVEFFNAARGYRYFTNHSPQQVDRA